MIAFGPWARWPLAEVGGNPMHCVVVWCCNGSSIFQWSGLHAGNRRFRRRFEKTAACFPEAQCTDEVTGNTSTQVDFLICEDGGTDARIVRKKGAYAHPYNLSIDSVALLGAYLDFVTAAVESEFNAGSVAKATLNGLFNW